jgi:biotin carboxyl carrier protein
MTFDVAVNGRPWKVAIEPAEHAGRFTIVVKGRKRVVDASWIDAQTLSLIDGSVAREVRIHHRNGALGVAIDGRMFEAIVAFGQDVRLKPRPADSGRMPGAATKVGRGSGPAGGGHAVKSPMPGRVMRVLVAAGDRVTAGQPVVVVEAMKMENELRAPGDGVVTAVNAQEGAAIDAGAVLVVIE